MSAPVSYRPMTRAEVALAAALGRCTIGPGTFSKRFARDVSAEARSPEPVISEKQAACLRRLVTVFRRQIAADSIPAAERHLLTRPTARMRQ